MSAARPSPRPVMTTEIRAWRRARLSGLSCPAIAGASGRNRTVVRLASGHLSRPYLVPVFHRHGVCLDEIQILFGVTPREAVGLIRSAGARA